MLAVATSPASSHARYARRRIPSFESIPNVDSVYNADGRLAVFRRFEQNTAESLYTREQRQRRRLPSQAGTISRSIGPAI